MTDARDGTPPMPDEPGIYLVFDERAAELAESTLRDEVQVGLFEAIHEPEGREKLVELFNRLGHEEIAGSLRDLRGEETATSRIFAAVWERAGDPDREFAVRPIDWSASWPDRPMSHEVLDSVDRRTRRYGHDRTELAGVALVESALIGLQRAKVVNEAVRNGSKLTLQPWVVEAHEAIGRHAAAVAHAPGSLPSTPADQSAERSVKLAAAGASVTAGSLGFAELLPPSAAAFVRALAGVIAGLALLVVGRAVNQFSERSRSRENASKARQRAERAWTGAKEARDGISAALDIRHRPMAAPPTTQRHRR